MLHGISWTAFVEAVLLLLLAYYSVVSLLFLRKDIGEVGRRWLKKAGLTLLPLAGLATALQAQTADGNNGINQANTLIRSYFQTGTQLMYAISAIIGLIGAIRVFILWNNGHRDEMNRAAANWFGSCIFIAVVSLIIQSFFGI